MSFFINSEEHSLACKLFYRANMFEKIEMIIQDFLEVKLLWFIISSEDVDAIRAHNAYMRLNYQSLDQKK